MPRIVPELRHTQFNDQGRRLRAVALARRSDYGMRVVFTATSSRLVSVRPRRAKPSRILSRRAVEVRQKTHGDVSSINYDDDGAYIHLSFSVATSETNLGRAYDTVRKICEELEETAEQTSVTIGKKIAAIAARLSGWGTASLDALVEAVDKAQTTDDKGRSLEELCSRLFETVPGFTVGGRVRTATEEIDISILNDSSDARFSILHCPHSVCRRLRHSRLHSRCWPNRSPRRPRTR